MKIADVIWGCRGGYSLAIGSRENGRIIFEIRCDIADEEYVTGIEIEPHQRQRIIAAVNAEHELKEMGIRADTQVRVVNDADLQSKATIWMDAHRPFFQPETMSMVTREHITNAMAAFTEECIRRINDR